MIDWAVAAYVGGVIGAAASRVGRWVLLPRREREILRTGRHPLVDAAFQAAFWPLVALFVLAYWVGELLSR